MTSTYEVTLVVDMGGEPKDDRHITKRVEAADKHAALDAARTKVRQENPDVNYTRIWAWTVMRLHGRS